MPVLLQSPGYPDAYPHNLMTAPCVWTVVSSGSNTVVCTFTDFDTEENYDVVTVCEGDCCAASILAVLSGSALLPTYSAASLTLQLTSDGTINRRGFSVSCDPAESSTIPPVSTTSTPLTSIPLTSTPPVSTTSPIYTTVPTATTSLPVTEITGIYFSSLSL